MTAVVILAGGRGARMGGNKPLAPYGASTLIEAVIDRLRPQANTLYINAGDAAHPLANELEKLDFPMTYDDPKLAGLGPLSGVLSALDLARDRGWDFIATVPCDMPHLPLDLLDQLRSVPTTDVVYFTGSRDYPLCALWKASLFNKLQDALLTARAPGGLAVHRFLDTVQVCRIVTEDDSAFVNINQAQDQMLGQ